MLVRGLAWSVVDDEDVAELLRRQPGARWWASRGRVTASRATGPSSWPRILSDFLYPERLMDRRVWFSRRALKLHAVILIVVPGFMALCLWQINRPSAATA